MSPSGGQRKVVRGHVAPVDGGRNGDCGDFRTQRTLRHGGHRGVRIEQAGEFASPRCRFDERGYGGVRAVGFRLGGISHRGSADTARPTGRRDSRPSDTERVGVDGAVDGIMENGQNVMEQLLHIQPQDVEIVLGRAGQVRTAAGLAHTFTVEPGRKHARAAFDQVELADVSGETRLRLGGALPQVLGRG